MVPAAAVIPTIVLCLFIFGEFYCVKTFKEFFVFSELKAGFGTQLFALVKGFC
jgi:hypothetical protein